MGYDWNSLRMKHIIWLASTNRLTLYIISILDSNSNMTFTDEKNGLLRWGTGGAQHEVQQGQCGEDQVPDLADCASTQSWKNIMDQYEKYDMYICIYAFTHIII